MPSVSFTRGFMTEEGMKFVTASFNVTNPGKHFHGAGSTVNAELAPGGRNPFDGRDADDLTGGLRVKFSNPTALWCTPRWVFPPSSVAVLYHDDISEYTYPASKVVTLQDD